MKVCRKCDNEYKDDYSFCPKCGTPHNPNTKYAKIPGELSHEAKEKLVFIFNILLYIVGAVIICIYLLNFKNDVKSSIFAILFGLSLFQIFYKLLETKSNTKLLMVLRVVIPLLLFIVWMICCPIKDKNEPKKTLDDNTEINQRNEEPSKNETTVDNTEEIPQQPTSTEEPEKEKENNKEIYEINYKELGKVGKMQDYEGADDYFYYIPSGTYEVTRKSGKDSICFLWIFYKKANKGSWGTEYDTKEKFTFKSNGQKETIGITSDVMVYNSNNCNYLFEKK